MARSSHSIKLFRLSASKRAAVLLVIFTSVAVMALIGLAMHNSGTQNESAVTQRTEKDSASIPAADPRTAQPKQELSEGPEERNLDATGSNPYDRDASEIPPEPDRKCRAELRRIQVTYRSTIEKEQDLLKERLGYPVVGTDIQTYYVQQHNDTVTDIYEQYAEEASQKGCNWTEEPPASFSIDELHR